MATKRKAVVIAIVLISIILTFSFIIYVGFKSPSVPSIPFTGAIWQRPIEHFATSLAVNDGKVFITDEPSDVYCFDSQNGESIWNASIMGRARNPSLVISDGRIYLGIEGYQVYCLDENNGSVLWTFVNRYTREGFSKGATPKITIEDSRLFAVAGTIGARNATTGRILWYLDSRIRSSVASFPKGQMQVSPLIGDIFDGKYVYATGGNYSNLHFFKIDMVNIKTIWRSNATWVGSYVFSFIPSIPLPSVLAVSQEKVIIRVFINETSSVNLFLCLDSVTGRELWSFDVGATIYNPTVHNGLLLFGAADGYFYAVRLTDGTIAWKTKVDTQNLFSFGVQSSSPIRIDPKKQRLFWGYAIKQNETSNNYTGALCSLNLANGNIKWMTQTNSSYGGLAFNNITDRLYLTSIYRFVADISLWIFNASTGDLIHSQQFDHYILPPIVLGKETLVAADLWLYSYS